MGALSLESSQVLNCIYPFSDIDEPIRLNATLDLIDGHSELFFSVSKKKAALRNKIKIQVDGFFCHKQTLTMNFFFSKTGNEYCP